jgi:fatty acid desaturase
MRSAPAASKLLRPDQLASLRQRSDAWGLWLVAHAWGVIALAMLLFARWPNPVTFLLAVALIGSRQLGLLILMHDGAHGMLARTPWLNRVLAQGFCAWPSFADTDVYRRYHLRHHARTMQDDDPDLVLTGHYPIARSSLWRKLRRDLLGNTGLTQRRAQLRGAWGPAGLPRAARAARIWRGLGPQLLANLSLCALLAAVGRWYFYPLLWLLPLLTWQQMVLRIRNIAEHAAVPDRNDPLKYARTTLANVLERAFVAPYWVNYHLEHHLLMWIPCYRLRRCHEALLANGFGPRMLVTQGYPAVLREVTFRDGERPPTVANGPRARAVGTFSDGFDATPS